MTDDEPTIGQGTTADRQSERLRAQRKLRLLSGALLGGLLGLAIAGVIVVGTRPATMPELTRARLREAEARWHEAAPRDYLLEVTVSGSQSAVYVVEVQEGEPVQATRNNRPLLQRRTWDAWTVPGLFDVIASDLDAVENNQQRLQLRCQFDPEYGYPAKYERIEFGTGLHITFEVTRFET